MEFYEKYTEDMILRDWLALDRTKLANERTLLGYIRTFLAFLATGFGIIKLTDDKIWNIIGVIISAVSVVFLIVGFCRFAKMRKKLNFHK